MADDPDLTSPDEPGVSPPWGPAARLVGRDRELGYLSAFTARTAVGGGALLIVGDAGVGKTALLEATAEQAEAAGVRILRSAGAEFEADVGFAGLQQLLYPLAEELQQLSAQHRRALSIGMGLEEGPRPDQLTIAHAVRALLVEAAAEAPVLVVVDDLQWLDQATAIALGMVGRRLGGSRVGLLAALRAGEGSFFESGGLNAFEVGRLDDEAAATLLAEHFPDLAPRDRQRVLADSQGNPLALMELPATKGGAGRPSAPGLTPVGRRLQTLFARRISGLPSEARRQLLLAALEGSGDLRVLPATHRGTRGLKAAEKARLIRIDAATHRLQFRHPLTRAAVVELSTDDERRQAHKALAKQVPEDSERRAWHLAQATVDPDDRIADLLEQAASKALRRGDPVGAMSLLLRAAELSPTAEDRNRRTLVAAYWGVDITGDLADARQLIDQALQGAGPSLAATVAAAAYMINGAGDMDTIHRLLVDAIKSSPDPSDAQNQSLVEALYLLQAATVFGSRPGLPDDFHVALERVVPEPPEFLALLGSCFVEPARLADARSPRRRDRG